MNITGQVDTSALNAQIASGKALTSRMAEKCVQGAAYAVAYQAYDVMWEMATTRAKIYSELGVMVTVRKNKKGKEMSAKRYQNFNRSGKLMGTENTKMSLAQLIVLAQMNHAGLNRKSGTSTTSYFNVKTGSRFAKPYARKGATLAALENKMLSARGKSGGFLAMGFAQILKLLRRDYKDQQAPPSEADNLGNSQFGAAYSQSTDTAAVCTIEHLIGMKEGKQGNNAAQRNNAMLQKCTPVLQRAIDWVAWDKMQHIANKELEAEANKWAAM